MSLINKRGRLSILRQDQSFLFFYNCMNLLKKLLPFFSIVVLIRHCYVTTNHVLRCFFILLFDLWNKVNKPTTFCRCFSFLLSIQ